MILSFRGAYSFLSNFHTCPVMGIDYKIYKSAESAFQAAKASDDNERIKFLDYSAREAKFAGKKVVLRPDWEHVRLHVMYSIVFDKFIRNPYLTQKLLKTENEYIKEGNSWGDKYWGVCNITGVGHNHLGKILMVVRSQLKTLKKVTL